MSQSTPSKSNGTTSGSAATSSEPTAIKLCSFCGQPCTDKTCDSLKCTEARARIGWAEPDSRGISKVLRGRDTQPEANRVRKGYFVRMLPSANDALRRAALREHVTMSELVERWAKSLPLE